MQDYTHKIRGSTFLHIMMYLILPKGSYQLGANCPVSRYSPQIFLGEYIETHMQDRSSHYLTTAYDVTLSRYADLAMFMRSLEMGELMAVGLFITDMPVAYTTAVNLEHHIQHSQTADTYMYTNMINHAMICTVDFAL